MHHVQKVYLCVRASIDQSHTGKMVIKTSKLSFLYKRLIHQSNTRASALHHCLFPGVYVQTFSSCLFLHVDYDALHAGGHLDASIPYPSFSRISMIKKTFKHSLICNNVVLPNEPEVRIALNVLYDAMYFGDADLPYA